MSPDAAYAARMATPVSVLGGAFMISTQARDFSKLVGLRARPAYALGRFSVLGRVDPAVVVAVAGSGTPT